MFAEEVFPGFVEEVGHGDGDPGGGWMGWRLDLESVTAGPDDVMPWGM